MKVALISTDSDAWSLGSRMISSVLRRAGHSTRLILLRRESAHYTAEVLEQTRALAGAADVVGLSCYSRGFGRARQLAAALRGMGKPVVWGGLHATLNPGECAAECDFVCRGEGEETIVELAEALESGRGWEQILNLAYFKGGKLVMNPLRPLYANLDTLPLFDFTREDEHQLTGRDIRQVSPRPADAPRDTVNFIGSRGCALHCTYCCNRKVKELYAGHGQYLRRMSPAVYVDHLATLYKEHFPRAAGFFLLDEDFFMRPIKELREFAGLYRERVGLPFDCLASPPRITEEKMRCLAEAGLWHVCVGVESGSERTKREVYDRPISNEIVVRASRVVRQFPSVTPVYFFINGNPYEEERDLLDTMRLMTQLAYPYYASIYNLVFFPGSELYERAVSDGIIAGWRDSGAELNYLGGFKVDKHAWKHKNLYLNGLLFLTAGKSTRHRLGAVPRRWVPVLIRPRVIEFMNRHRTACRLLIGGRVGARTVRAGARAALRKVTASPAGICYWPRRVKDAARSSVTRLLGALKLGA